MAKVSVIVPVYNVRDYLSGAVESLLRQTERDLEIILVDDGSTDGSGALCDRFAEEDGRIRVLHKENGGLSSARNAGAGEASAEYVLFLDGDDYLCDDAVETLVLASDRYRPDVVQFLYKEVETTGRQSRHETESWTAFTASEPAALFENLYRLGGVAASGCTKLIKRQLVLDFPFEKIRHEDERWCTRVFPADVTVTYIPDILYCYVMREGSIIHASFNPDKLEVFKVQEERIRTLNALSLHDLAEREYAKMFLSVLTLYREASNGADQGSCKAIREQFKKNRKAFFGSSFIKGRFKIILLLMAVHFSWIKLYLGYCRKKTQKKT